MSISIFNTLKSLHNKGRFIYINVRIVVLSYILKNCMFRWTKGSRINSSFLNGSDIKRVGGGKGLPLRKKNFFSILLPFKNE